MYFYCLDSLAFPGCLLFQYTVWKCEAKRKSRGVITILFLVSWGLFLLLSTFLSLIYIYFIYNIQSFKPYLVRGIEKSTLSFQKSSVRVFNLPFILPFSEVMYIKFLSNIWSYKNFLNLITYICKNRIIIFIAQGRCE